MTRDGSRVVPDIDRVVWRDLDEDIVLFDLDTGRSAMLRGSASVLWRGLSTDGIAERGGRSVGDLAELLVTMYAIDDDLAVADAESFVDDLRARGYVRSSDE